MTTAVFRNTSSLTVPPTQNTAQVLEFNCLYTHDVRKKAKKWQDGFLRYHTFNKRVMVYDIPRNLIGDLHWTGDVSVQEGDELALENKAVMVEVCNSTGQQHTDLTELQNSRRKAPVHKGETNPSVGIPQRSALSAKMASQTAQLRHKSLRTLLGTGGGSIGKADSRSQYEEQHGAYENEKREDGRPLKKRRTSAALSSGATRTAKPRHLYDSSSGKVLARIAYPFARMTAEPQIQTFTTEGMSVISSESNSKLLCTSNTSDDAFAHSLSAAGTYPVQTGDLSDAESVALHAHSARRAATMLAKNLRQGVATGDQSNRGSRVAMPLARSENSQEVSSKLGCASSHARPSTLPKTVLQSRSKIEQVLRLNAGAPKKKSLVCQNQFLKKSKRAISTNQNESPHKVAAGEASSNMPQSSARKQLEARLARIDKKNGSTSTSRLMSRSSMSKAAEVDNNDNVTPRKRTECDSLSLTHEPGALRMEPDCRCSPSSRERYQPLHTLHQSRTSEPSRPPSVPIVGAPSPSSTGPSRNTGNAAVTSPAKQNFVQGDNERATSLICGWEERKSQQRSPSLVYPCASVLLSPEAPHSARKQQIKQQPESFRNHGPWSREAFDLFTWRPPDWDEEKWCLKSSRT